MNLNWILMQQIQLSNGADSYILKPVIRVITETKGGAIKGIVFPEDQNVAITVMDGDNIIAATYAPMDRSGFLLSGIDEGNYSLKFEPESIADIPDDPVYQSKQIENIEVITGKVTDVGAVELELQE